MPELPGYDELPRTAEGAPSGWGLFGEGDNLGLINLMTRERVLEAAGLIRRGAVFSLDEPLDAFSPTLALRRGIPRHTVLHREGSSTFDDVVDNFYPQASSQWDSLAHAGYAPGVFYNGVSEAEISAGERNTIEHWAEHGIVGRAVLLDLVRALGQVGRPFDPSAPVAFGVEELELARELANVTYRPGDVLLVHTGFGAWYKAQSPQVRFELPPKLTTAGLAHSEEVCAYLWDAHVSVVAADNLAVEVWPADSRPESRPFGLLHNILIGQFGMALGELWYLEALAADCAADGVYEAFFVGKPLHLRGGIGSSANAMVIK